MALAKLNLVVQNDTGDIVDGASISVQNEDTLAFPQLYSNRAGSSAIGNPFTAADGADAGFYVTGGSYKIIATSGAFSRTWRNVAVGTAAEHDFEDFGVNSFLVETYGAVGDGTTDDYNAITAALAAASADGGGVVRLAAKTYFLSDGIVVPDGVTIEGDLFHIDNTSKGSRLLFDLIITDPLVTIGTFLNGPGGLKRVVIERESGSPVPAGSIGVLVDRTEHVIFEDVWVLRNAKNWRFYSTIDGIVAFGNRIFSSSATDTHCEFDGWPEGRFTHCRFGLNGIDDIACSSWVRISGGAIPAAAGGPNGIVFDNSQFNSAVTNGVEFQDITIGPANAAVYKFIGCHFEGCTHVVGHDGSWGNLANIGFINNLNFMDCDFNIVTEFWNLPYSGSPNGNPIWVIQCTMTACLIGGPFTFDPGFEIYGFGIVGCKFTSDVHIRGTANGHMAVVGCDFLDDVTISGAWGTGGLLFTGTQATGKTVTDTSTGNKTVMVNGALSQSGSVSGSFGIFSSAIFTGSYISQNIPSIKTGTSYTVADNDVSLIFNAGGTFTLTLPSASGLNGGRWLYVKNIAAQLLNSASSNVKPLGTDTAGTAILTANAGRWAAMQSDGTNWVIMMGVV